MNLTGITITAKDGTPIVKELSLELPSECGLLVVGESGSGKTSLLEAIAGLSPHRVTGSFASSEEETEAATASMKGTLLAVQDAGAAFSPFWRLGSQLADGFARGSDPGNARYRVVELLDRLGLDSAVVMNSFPHELSAGMLKRTLVAAVLAAQPKLALFDEPTAGIDPSRRWAVMAAIRAGQGRFVVATHDIDMVRAADNDCALVMYRGEPVEFGPAVSVCRSPSHPYARKLLGG